MKARLVIFVSVAVVAAAGLVSVASAGPAATKQRVAIDARIMLPGQTMGSFVLAPVTTATLRADSGVFAGNWRSVPGRELMRSGQKVTIYNGVLWTLTGKQGTITIRERTESVAIGNDACNDGQPDSVATGSWKVMSATGDYAGIKGAGRSAHERLGVIWFARYEGVLTLP